MDSTTGSVGWWMGRVFRGRGSGLSKISRCGGVWRCMQDLCALVCRIALDVIMSLVVFDSAPIMSEHSLWPDDLHYDRKQQANNDACVERLIFVRYYGWACFCAVSEHYPSAPPGCPPLFALSQRSSRVGSRPECHLTDSSGSCEVATVELKVFDVLLKATNTKSSSESNTALRRVSIKSYEIEDCAPSHATPARLWRS